MDIDISHIQKRYIETYRYNPISVYEKTLNATPYTHFKKLLMFCYMFHLFFPFVQVFSSMARTHFIPQYSGRH